MPADRVFECVVDVEVLRVERGDCCRAGRPVQVSSQQGADEAAVLGLLVNLRGGPLEFGGERRRRGSLGGGHIVSLSFCRA